MSPRQQESRDPRGPTRTITGIEERSDITLLSLSCGHTGRANQIFHYKIGEECRCFDCGPHGRPSTPRPVVGRAPGRRGERPADQMPWRG